MRRTIRIPGVRAWPNAFSVALLCCLAFCGQRAVAGAETLPLTNLLFGAWTDVSNRASVIGFAPGRFIQHEQGMTTAARVEYGQDTVRLHIQGRTVDYGARFVGPELRLSTKQTERRFRKLAQVPSVLDIQPVVLGTRRELGPEALAAIQAELKHRAEQDQSVRFTSIRLDVIYQVDQENTAWLKKLVQDVGWLDVDRFGSDAARAAFLIVQHSSDLPLMRAALAPLEADVKAAKLTSDPYALLFDRVQVNLGELQRYGTQVGQNDAGEWALMPMEDPKRVNERRAELGLGPLSAYLEIVRRQLGVQTIRADGVPTTARVEPAKGR